MEKKEVKEEVSNKSYLQEGNQVSLKEGTITFGKWNNGDSNNAVRRACSDRELSRITAKIGMSTYINAMTLNWLIAYSVQKGSGFLKGDRVEETFSKIQKLEPGDAYSLGKAFYEFQEMVIGDIKKK